MSEKRTVLHPDSIVPFFINATNDGQRLFEVVQVPMNKVDPLAIAQGIVKDYSFGLNSGFTRQICSLVESQLDDFKKTAIQHPISEWAEKGSAVHILSLEVGINTVIYNDMIEWDIFDETADPDAFARITVKELALPVEFVNVISAQIRWQVIRFRAMHCYPDRLRRAIENKTVFPPHVTRNLRPVAELLDASPVVGLVQGATTKKSISSLNRQTRHLKRQGHAVSNGALYPEEDPGKIQVKFVPLVRASPMPEDSPDIDLASIPHMITDDAYNNPELIEKVRKKFNSPLFSAQNQASDDSGSDSAGEN